MNNRLITIALVSFLLLTGCGDGDGEDSTTVDTSDPIQVAEAFFEAIVEADIDSAVEYVLPEHAADFRESMRDGMPVLPPNYEVTVMVRGENGDAYIVGTSLEVDMSLVDGRWWMKR